MTCDMAYQRQQLGALVRIDPAAARAKIVEAHQQTKGNTTTAAKLLGVGRRSLVRWITQLDIRALVDTRPPDARAGQRGTGGRRPAQPAPPAKSRPKRAPRRN